MKEFLAKTFTKENLKRFFFSFCWLIPVIVLIDLITKWSVLNYFRDKFGDSIFSEYGVRNPRDMVLILPNFLYIGFALNKGAAWSLGTSDNFDGVNPILLIISIVLGTGLLIYYIKTHKKNTRWVNVSLCLMIAGAYGNLIDRAFYRTSITGFKGVIDWIQAYPFGYSFPTFNIADSSLVVGVAILIVLFIIDLIKEAIEKGKNGEYKYSPKELKEQKENAENKSK